MNAIGFYGGAAEGMRTMLDALLPAVSALEAGKFLVPRVPRVYVHLWRAILVVSMSN